MSEPSPCHYCGGVGTTRDHIVARKKLRRLAIPSEHPFFAANVISACPDCNSRKGHKRSACTCSRCAMVWMAYQHLLQGIEPQLDVVA